MYDLIHSLSSPPTTRILSLLETQDDKLSVVLNVTDHTEYYNSRVPLKGGVQGWPQLY